VLGDAKERCRNHASNKGCYHKPSEHLPASRSVTRVSSTKQGPLGSTWGKQCYSSLPHARACFAPNSLKAYSEVIKAGFGTAEVEAGANTGQGPLPHPREY